MKRAEKIKSGQTFGRWTVESLVPCDPANYKSPRWSCVCQCGTRRDVYAGSLRAGSSVSCGCWRDDMMRARVTHGLSRTPEYQSWSAMWHRCSEPTADSYYRYGGRGIKVDPAWESVEKFVKDMGRRPTPEHSLDRLDNDGPYCKANCEWSTMQTQNDNRSISRKLTFRGITQSVQRWSEQTGIKYTTIIRRIDHHLWDIEKALTRTAAFTKSSRPRNQQGQYA